MPFMAVQSTPFGPVAVSGDDAKAFRRKMLQGWGIKAAAESAANGRKLITVFASTGAAVIELKVTRAG